jgi:mono/diheme cytochrome c family protein
MKPMLPMMFLVLVASSGCRQDMAQQPAYRPLRASAFFADGRSARPLVPGTIARGSTLSTGTKPVASKDWAALVGVIGTISDNPVAAASRTTAWSSYRASFPISITSKTLERGRDRFNIYCSVCHDRVGTGRGTVVERGFTPPPSFHTDLSRGFKRKSIDLKLRDAPVGYYFEVITHGFGAMPDYAEQVTADDRWAIIAYIRALQFSQHASLADVRDETEKARLVTSKGAAP